MQSLPSELISFISAFRPLLRAEVFDSFSFLLLGILVGDGRLPHPGAEQILETYYNARVWSTAHVTLDYQWVKNPAYNSDRGPVSVIAVRVHAEF